MNSLLFLPILLFAAASAQPSIWATEAHNAYRAKHCAPPLTWSDSLASSASAHAATCQGLTHSTDPGGENIARWTNDVDGVNPEIHKQDATDKQKDWQDAVDGWYNEVTDPGFTWPATGNNQPGTGHFTQMIWVSNTEVGCGRFDCGDRQVIVCQYLPGGVQTAPGDPELEKEIWSKNVLPTGCSPSDAAAAGQIQGVAPLGADGQPKAPAGVAAPTSAPANGEGGVVPVDSEPEPMPVDETVPVDSETMPVDEEVRGDTAPVDEMPVDESSSAVEAAPVDYQAVPP